VRYIPCCTLKKTPEKPDFLGFKGLINCVYVKNVTESLWSLAIRGRGSRGE